ncbi:MULTISPECIES: ferritin-like domain-containing protein [Rhizobium]|uniref:Ferritin-like protein n=1 Tax=Rhizobium aouanii TaxID=3118145 RepID=A0ABU8CKE2_9HYPH|nr:ferritin-like protein [Rhizobium acaciae]MCW1410821.1 ferritin-like protein [Rhizobium acaciae]MCW1742880.1 ferritin-like protein [Rhizobium acaciae]MCW1750076.1 ferritin-like protein [Rhizobium acaciae]
MRSRVTEQLHQILDQSLKARVTRAKSLGPESASSSTFVVPTGFSPHDYAVFLLHVAAEIEHGLLIQYLFAAYSLGGPQVPEKERPKVVRWQTILLGIAREEMGHLITVQNLLKLIGGPLNLERDDFPWDLPFYPFPFALEPLSAKLIARYVCIESPDVWPDHWAAQQKEITKLAFPEGSDGFNRVGLIYGNLKTLLGDKTLMPDSSFHADTLSYQASFDEWGRGYAGGARGAATPGAATPDVLIHTAYSRKTALDALDAIAEQGEAADAISQENDLSHFERFMELYQEFSAESGSSRLCRPVISNPRVVGDADAVPNTTYIAHPPSRHWAELLNLRYRMLLTYLSHTFRISGKTGRAEGMVRGAVLNRAFGEMYNLRAIANILVTLPAIDAATVARAAPTFELPYTLTLPYLERDVWGLHLDLLKASGDLIAGVQGTAGTDADAFLASLMAIDANAAKTFQSALNGCFTPAPGGMS